MDVSPTKVIRPNQPAGLPVESIPAEQPDAVLLDGESVSPDGRYHLWLMKGEDSDQAENLIVWDSEENLTKWWDDVESNSPPSAIWSHDGTYLAIERTTPDGELITVIETENWTDWDVTMPDGSLIPEDAILQDEWGIWTEENVLRFVVGKKDAETSVTYRCILQVEGGILEGTTDYAEKVLAKGFDLDDDGVLESVTLEGNAGDKSDFWVLRIMEDGEELWADSAGIPHVGWNTIFVCHINDDDYLLRYRPTMYQGFASYTYELFFLSETGEERVVMQNQVDFDVKFDAPYHESFEVDAIADFLWELRGYLEDSTLLLSTEDGLFQSGVTFDQLIYYPFGASYENLMAIEDKDALEEALEQFVEVSKTEQGLN